MWKTLSLPSQRRLFFKVRDFAFNFGAGDLAAGAVGPELTRQPIGALHFESGALARDVSFAQSSSLRTLRAQSTKTPRFSLFFFQIKPLFNFTRSKKNLEKKINFFQRTFKERKEQKKSEKNQNDEGKKMPFWTKRSGADSQTVQWKLAATFTGK